MGGKTETKNTASIDPAVAALQQGNYARAQTVADTPAGQYTGQLGAQLDPNVGAASDAFKGLTSFSAPDVSGTSYDPSLVNRGDIRNISAGQLANTDLTPYLNRYTGDVIDAASKDLSRQYGIDSTNANAQATAAGAFGGSRSGVLSGIVNDNYQRNLNSTVAGLRQSGFQNAQGAAAQDIANRMAADNTNAGYDYSVASGNASAKTAASAYGAQAAQQAALANQQAALASAGVRSGAAGNLGQLGLAATANTQTGLNGAYQEWLRQQQDPLVKQGLLNSSLAGVSAPVSTDSTQTKTPGLLDYVNSGLGAATSIFGGGFGSGLFKSGSSGADAAMPYGGHYTF